ncbi:MULTISPECIES: sensor histidine kinase [Idiomarina]|uniref:sensor histidine kinase n=1 Tax=Idiomarina TaxID=135575 RepID=UPI00129AB5AC|nr:MULTISPECIES: HAMP domain-containing sensor histidine kinase [Idiomarina]MRJ41576.1 sensor histidine kinase [Idiomarina sp. FeN1]NCU57566.1 sensor histidine kinase [Idiomarina sp. FenA--70]NCU60118.1 sensor histidine kinase [Idiomarina sp. FenBw--71]UUN13786.1 sensor histidine kinase [Idiomarina loihiensis]
MSTSSISKSLLTSVLSVYFVLTLLVTSIQVVGEYFDTKSVLIQELQNQQSTFSYPLARSLWEYNSPQIDAIADGLINIPAIAGLIIRDDTGKVVIELGQTIPISQLPNGPTEAFELNERDGVFGYFSTLVFEFSGDSTLVGDVTLFSTRDIAIERIKVSLYFIIGSALIKSTFLILLFSLAFSRMLNRPMADLIDQIKNFRLDDLEHSKVHLRDQRNTEFVLLEQAYNQLIDTLYDYQEGLQQTEQQLLQANKKLDEQNNILEQEVARKTSNITRIVIDLERRKHELETRQDSLENEIRQRQAVESELRKTNQRLQTSLSALERAQDQLLESEKMASLGGLVAGITHDVNTPIGVSVTAATLIRDRLLDTEQALHNRELTQTQLETFLAQGKEALNVVERNLARASDLISSFKQVAVDQTSEATRDINIKAYLTDVIQALQPQLRHTEHRISVSCPEHLEARCPAGALAQIFTNLIMNSVIHGFEAKPKGNIDITIARSQDRLHVIYQDNGKGLDQQQLKQLFDPFFTTKQKQGGSGLGTHIVRNLVTQTLAGEIRAESAPNQGLRYVIEFPLTFLDPTE